MTMCHIGSIAAKDPALVLLPGLLCDGVLWQDTLAALNCELPVALMDLKGQATIEAMAERVLAHAPPRFAIAGFSMGGQVAIEVWKRAPERVVRLALMSTNPFGLTPVVRQHLSNAIARVQADGLDRYLSDAFPLYFSEAGRSNPTLKATFLGMAHRLGPDVAVQQMQALLSYAGAAFDLSAICCPTLVVCGALDARTPPLLHERIASSIPQATLCVVKGSAHFTLLESPVVVACALRSWLGF